MEESQKDPSRSNEASILCCNLIHQVVEQIVEQQQAGQSPQIEEYLKRFPQVQDEIREVWSVLVMIDQLSPDRSASSPLVAEFHSEIHSQKSVVEGRLPNAETPITEIDSGIGTPKPAQFELDGAFIGRYRIRQLGRGGFGTVYLAIDTELDRLVAIKLPHPHRMSSGSAKRSYLLEARTLAKLDHPNIVPVFDFGMMTDGRCFVVSKFQNMWRGRI